MKGWSVYRSLYNLKEEQQLLTPDFRKIVSVFNLLGEDEEGGGIKWKKSCCDVVGPR